MRVITYLATDPDVPESMRAIARIRCGMPTKNGKFVEDWSPVIFCGSDPEALREQAQSWWESELARAAGKKRLGRPPKAKAPEPVEDEIII